MAIAALGVVFAGCGQAAPAASATVSAPAAVSVSAPPAATVPGSPNAPVGVEAELLDLLPAEIGGLPLTFSQEGSATAAGDPGLAATAESVAYGLLADDLGDDIAVVSIVRLHDGVFGDELFRRWRETYDAEVCRTAGVTGHAQAEIGGRTVHIGTCARGGHTHHAWVEAERAIVSIYSAGERRLGELAISHLGRP